MANILIGAPSITDISRYSNYTYDLKVYKCISDIDLSIFSNPLSEFDKNKVKNKIRNFSLNELKEKFSGYFSEAQIEVIIGMSHEYRYVEVDLSNKEFGRVKDSHYFPIKNIIII